MAKKTKAKKTKAKTTKAKKPARMAARVAKRKAKPATAPRKAAKTAWQPKDYPTMSPYAVLDDCRRAIEWYQDVLGAKVRMIMDGPGGAVAHCELQLGDSVLMMGSPMQGFGPRKAHLALYVKDVDATFAKAMATGARQVQPVSDQFYGDRSGRFEDPFGNEWNIATHVRDVSEKEMVEAMKQMGG